MEDENVIFNRVLVHCGPGAFRLRFVLGRFRIGSYGSHNTQTSLTKVTENFPERDGDIIQKLKSVERSR